MAEPVIKLKRSSETGKLPQPEDLEFGELALNYADGKLYYKKDSGLIDSIGTGGSAGTRRRYEQIATADQTTFIFSTGYSPGFIDVIHNGSTLGLADYTATDGTTVILNEPAQQDDIIILIAYDPVGLADTYRKEEVDEITTEKAIVMAIALG